jgi:hypothetical protein
LNPDPTPDFPETEMIASSKLHDEAACATPAPRTSNEGTNERKNRMIVAVECE